MRLVLLDACGSARELVLSEAYSDLRFDVQRSSRDGVSRQDTGMRARTGVLAEASGRTDKSCVRVYTCVGSMCTTHEKHNGSLMYNISRLARSEA